METLLKLVSMKRRGDEEGWSLTSTLVTVGLTLLVGVVVIGIITSATRGSNQFSDSVMTENELNNAISTMGRQLTTAEKIEYADKDLIRVVNVNNGAKSSTAYFAWTPSSWDNVKGNLSGAGAVGKSLDVSDLPKFPAVVSATTPYDDKNTPKDEKPSVRVLVNGFVKSDSNALFTYFNKADSPLTTVPVPNDQLGSIKRVQIQLNATVEGRDAPMQLATSVTPRSGLSTTQGATYADVREAPAAPALTGSLPPRTAQSTLNWNNVDGADSYTIYRENAKQATNPQVIGTTTKTTINDTKISWGEAYTYYIIASNVNGLSPSSNRLTLTATPPAPVIKGSVNTDFTNTVTWPLVNGATGYRLLRDGKNVTTITNTTSTPTFKDTTVKAGETHTYKAVAYNAAGTGKDDALGNGDSPWSNEVTLYANPKAPILTGSVNKGDRNLSWSTIAGSTGYELKRISPNGKAFPVQTTTTYADKEQIKATTFTYQVRAKNASGYSDWSNVVTLNPNPNPVQPTVWDYTDSSTSYNAKNKITWPSDSQATYYDWRLGRKNGVIPSNTDFTNVGNNLSYWDNNPGTDSNISYDVRACNYTGCSAIKWDWGRQPPGTFSVNDYDDFSRTGYTSARDDDRKVDPEYAKFYWTGSSGATSYEGKLGSTVIMPNGSASARNFIAEAGKYTPGKAYTIAVTAKGANSGLSRASTMKWQATPAQPDNVSFRFQYKRNGSSVDSRMAIWANYDMGRKGYVASKGVSDDVELRYGYRGRNNGKDDFGFTVTGDTWNKWGKTVYTQSFSKSGINEGNKAEKGGIGWGRSYKTLTSGYKGSSLSQDSSSGRGWWNTNKQDDKQFNGGYRGIFGGTTTGNNNPWTGKNGSGSVGNTSTWTNVPWSKANFVQSGAQKGCTSSCTNYWMIQSR